MYAVRLSRAALALLIIGVLVGGVVLGSAVTALVASPASPPATAAPEPSAASSGAGLPRTDVAGEDFVRLPRYPGSVRTEYEVSIDERFRLTAVEYFAEDALDPVRAFYQSVIDEHGWQRADITYSGGEWTYVLVDGTTEALVELEVTRGFVEIDIQVSKPLSTETPDPTPSPPPAATPAPTPVPAAPAPPGDDDDDDGDDDDSDDGEGDSDD